MCEPLAFISDDFGDELAQLSVALVYPFSWVDAWLYQHERFVQEVVVFPQWTGLFLKQDLALQLTAEDNLIAAHKAQIGQPDHARFCINQSHKINFLS